MNHAGGRLVALSVVVVLALASHASASFNVTDEHTGQTFDALVYLDAPYPCAAPCAFTFTARQECSPGGQSQYTWLIRDASDQLIDQRFLVTSWHYDFTALGRYSVVESESTGTCGTGGTFRLQVLDETPPETTITASPSAVTDDTTPTFGFSANEAGSKFSCSVDGAVAKPCTSPFTTQPLANGTHRLTVQATDGSGNVDPTPATATFRIAHYIRIRPEIASTWRHHGDTIGVAILHVTNVPSKASVVVVCHGEGCPFTRRVLEPIHRVVRVERVFGDALLGPATRIDITVRAPDAIAKVFRFRVRRGGLDPIGRVLCQKPGAKQPSRC